MQFSIVFEGEMRTQLSITSQLLAITYTKLFTINTSIDTDRIATNSNWFISCQKHILI